MITLNQYILYSRLRLMVLPQMTCSYLRLTAQPPMTCSRQGPTAPPSDSREHVPAPLPNPGKSIPALPPHPARMSPTYCLLPTRMPHVCFLTSLGKVNMSDNACLVTLGFACTFYQEGLQGCKFTRVKTPLPL